MHEGCQKLTLRTNIYPTFANKRFHIEFKIQIENNLLNELNYCICLVKMVG